MNEDIALLFLKLAELGYTVKDFNAAGGGNIELLLAKAGE
jgi:hypothetical protein